MPDEVVCPMPRAITHESARSMYLQVRKEMRGVTDSAIRREAARRMGVDYDTFLKAWKKPVVKPKPPTTLDPQTATYDDVFKGWSNASEDQDVADWVFDLSGPTIDVNVKDLYAGQDIRLDHSHIASLVKNGITKDRDDLPIAVLVDGKMYLVDGHHRAIAAYIRGEKLSVRRVVLDKKDVPNLKSGPYRKDTPVTPSPVAPKPKPAPDLPKPKPAPEPNVKPPLTYESARAQAKLVKKENPTWTEAQVRRESARRMAVPYDEYLRAWKTKTSTTTPAPVRINPEPVRRVPDFAPPPVPKHLAPRFKRKQPVASGGPIQVKQRLLIEGKTVKQTAYTNDAGHELGRLVWIKGRVREHTAIQGQHQKSFRTEGEAHDWLVSRIEADGGMLPDVKAVNPGFQVEVGTTHNCTSCATSYELRRRGYDVVAGTMPTGQPLRYVYDSWGIRWQNQIGTGNINGMRSTQKMDWAANGVSQVPDGARGFITVMWKRGGSHIFNWERRGNTIWYIDAQSGVETRSFNDWYNSAQPEILIARVDNIPETQRVEWLAKEDRQTPIDSSERPWT